MSSLLILLKTPFGHLAQAELNTKHQEQQWRKMDDFIMNGTTQENGESPKPPIQALGRFLKGPQGAGMQKHWWGKFNGRTMELDHAC